MRNAFSLRGAALIALALTLFAGAFSLAAPDEKTAKVAPRPKLGVVLVFDQMRGDYLIKWKDLFCEGGFKRLQTQGAWFVDCHYPYSDTVTAAGHASLLTGCTPHDHGIIANAWYDRDTGKRVQSITGMFGPDPLRRQRPTVGDALIAQTKGKAKVVSLSIKDRAAILMAALRAQVVCWLGNEDEFVTSKHYAEEPKSWVKDYNKAGKIRSYLGQSWNKLQPKLDYQRFSGPDNVKNEGDGYNQGRTFPHPTPSTAAVCCSPFGNELLLDFAKTAIEAEQLGRGEATDLLCLSFSSNDMIGHCFGPDSQEVLDVTLRSDLIVKELLEFLDAKVGKDNYFVVLSADHGVCPLPEAAKTHGKKADRVLYSLVNGQAQEFLQETFAKGKEKINWIEASSAPWIYLDKTAIADAGLEQAAVEKALTNWFVKQPGVERAFSRTELMSATPLKDKMAEQVRQSFHVERSGDVTVILKPYHILGGAPTKGKNPDGTTHGSPHPYDTHVPLLAFGPGIRPGVHNQRVAPQCLTPILARGLGIDPPASATFSAPSDLFETADVAKTARSRTKLPRLAY